MMNELTNCPSCQALFVKNQFRDVCETCYKEEEAIFNEVYQYIRKRENRTATIIQVVEATGVDESLLMKFIKSGKLRIASNPNLGYACEHCGSIIREGRFCGGCRDDLRANLERHESNEALHKGIDDRQRQMTYYRRKHVGK